MPTTFTPGDEKQDEKLNPGQQHADRRFSDLAGAEKRGTADMSDFERNYGENANSSAEDDNIQKLKDSESSSSPGSNWANNVTDGNNSPQKSKFKGWFKKAGPVVGAGGIVGIAGFIMIGLTSPSLLIVQMKEMMTEKFNTQLSSMQTRSNKLLMSKIDNSTKGFCSSTVNIRCKYSSMSDKQIAKFKAAGIEVEARQGGVKIPGRTNPAAFTFQGETISASDFSRRANTDAAFRSALKQAYNPKYAGFVGKAWDNVSARYRISKQAPELTAREGEEKAKQRLNQISSEGTNDTTGRSRVEADAECKSNECFDDSRASTVNSTAETAERAKADGSAAADVRAQLSGLNSGTATAVFKATGAIDTACQVYGGMTALSYATKTIRAAQLVRYSMIFLTVADTIKAGKSPNPEDVALLGTVLTTTIKDSTNPSNTLISSATDSFGYKYAAFGDVSAPEKSMTIANRFTSGGGFVGKMSSVSNSVMSAFGGDRKKARSTCGFLANPVVQGTSLVLGVAMLFVPGVNAVKVATQGAATIALGAAIAVLPSLLADIAAGTVTNDIVGEEAGNAIASGSGALLSDALAGQSGNAPMSKEDAIAYNSHQTEVLNQYIADELRETSPFDATNPHTFIGSIANSLLPLQSSSNPITTVGSLLSNSLSSAIPKSSAVANAEYAQSLEVCQDLDVLESKYAADPFCNTIRGIPPKYLDKDPLDVINELLNEGKITEDGAPNPDLKAFIDKCMLSDKPFGYSDPTAGFNPDEASECIIDDQNANYYLYHMDQTIDSGFDGNYGETTTQQAVPSDGTLPSGTAIELAQMILNSGRVTDRTDQLTQIINGSRSNVQTGILQTLASLSSTHTFTISSMKRDQALGVGAGNRSLHLLGMAADISGSSGINGVPFGYNGHNPAVQAFIDSAAAILPPGCQIGVPNQAYVNATKPKVKPGCAVFVDIGTAPHIHLGARGGE